MKRLNLIFILCFTVLFSLNSISNAQGHRRGFHKGNRMQQTCQMECLLNLTEDQKSQMATLRLDLQKKILPLRTDIQGKMTEIRLLKAESNPGLKKIDKLIEEKGKIRTEIQKLRTRHQLDVKKLLTPEQQKIYDNRMLNNHKHRSFRGHRKNCW